MCVDYQINVFCFTVVHFYLLEVNLPLKRTSCFICSHPEPLWDPKSACICCRSATNVFSLTEEGTEVIVCCGITDTGHFMSERISAKMSSEDGHEMPRVQLMLICAQPWLRWSKQGHDSSSESNARLHNFSGTPRKHVKPKRWNRWKDYSLLISCCPSLI